MRNFLSNGMVADIADIADEIGYRPEIEISMSPDWNEIQGWELVEKRTHHYYDVVKKVFSIRREANTERYFLRRKLNMLLKPLQENG